VINISSDNILKIKGFSLVELMVAIGLMLIVLMVAVPNYENFRRGKTLDKAYQEMVADLRMGQEYAMSGKKPQEAASPCITSTLQGYYIDKILPSTYLIRVQCGGTLYTVKSVRMDNVTLNNFGSFGFKPLGGGTTINIGGTRTIILTDNITAQTER
jgi:prepilin-type N-terminal cleavage/methylation domain-containing protein